MYDGGIIIYDDGIIMYEGGIIIYDDGIIIYDDGIIIYDDGIIRYDRICDKEIDLLIQNLNKTKKLQTLKFEAFIWCNYTS